MKWLSTVTQVEAGALEVERMELDESGFPQPTGEREVLEADSLVLALGQETDLSILDGVPGLSVEDGVVVVDDRMHTGCEGVFAGGDMVPRERSVTAAIGHGRLAARSIDAWLSDAAPEPDVPRSLATFDTLNPWYYSDAERTHRPVLDQARRESTFDEVVQGLDESTALFEARRCLSCGSCFGCDNCYGMCPDNAVLKIGAPRSGGYLIDLDYCKGCGICVQECPSGAIQMFPEDI
jgi:Pyruvate/2-oxoacid:ferredoxin oxidoreductase delta subunit